MAQGKGIYKRGNVWWLAYADASGGTVRESSGTSDYRTALRLLAERRAAVARGREVSKLKASNVMFSNAMEKYLAWAKPQRSYMSKVHMSRDLILRFGNIPL